MKRYYNNDLINNDPSRIGNHTYNYNNNSDNYNYHDNYNDDNNDSLIKFNQPLNSRSNSNFHYQPNNQQQFNNQQFNNQQFNHLNKLNNANNTFNKQRLNNQLNNEIKIQELLPKKIGSETSMVPLNNNLVNFHNEINRYQNMSQELMDKDEEIQKYKNEVYKLQLTITDVQKEQQKSITNEIENKLLRVKLNEQYTITKELTEMKHKLKKEKMEIKEKDETITMLKKIIHKQHLRLSNGPSDSESEYSSSEEEYSEDEDDEEDEIDQKKKNIYINGGLKSALKKYDKTFTDKKIDSLFIQMKITPQSKVTKPLLQSIIKLLKNN